MRLITLQTKLGARKAMAIAAERIVVPALLKLQPLPAVEAVDAVDDAEAYSLSLQEMTLL